VNLKIENQIVTVHISSIFCSEVVFRLIIELFEMPFLKKILGGLVMSYVFEVTPFMVCWMIGCSCLFPLFIPGNLRKFLSFIHKLVIGLEDRTLERVVDRHDGLRRSTVGDRWSTKRYRK